MNLTAEPSPQQQHLPQKAPGDLTNACTDAATYGPVGPLTDLAGTTGWTPNAPNETQAFHFQVTVGPDAAQNAAADGITLTWSLETTG